MVGEELILPLSALGERLPLTRSSQKAPRVSVTCKLVHCTIIIHEVAVVLEESKQHNTHDYQSTNCYLKPATTSVDKIHNIELVSGLPHLLE